MNPLEESLGYTFRNTTLLHQAITHPSALSPGQGRDFERLEFLGDRVLGLIIAQWLWEEFPHGKRRRSLQTIYRPGPQRNSR